jgi:hypothetical protein
MKQYLNKNLYFDENNINIPNGNLYGFSTFVLTGTSVQNFISPSVTGELFYNFYQYSSNVNYAFECGKIDISNFSYSATTEQKCSVKDIFYYNWNGSYSQVNFNMIYDSTNNIFQIQSLSNSGTGILEYMFYGVDF